MLRRTKGDLNQIALSSFDDELAASIRQVAEWEHTSMGQATLKLLRNGARSEVKPKPAGKIGNSLDHFFGGWSKEEAAEFDAFLAETHVVDESDW